MGDELMHTVQKLSNLLSSKLSQIMAFLAEHKHASSIGAVAGFALTLICTWRYLRGRQRARRQLDKRNASLAGPSGVDAVVSSSGASTSITKATHRGSSISSIASPPQITSAEMVRRQLNGGRRMTCQLLGVVLEETSPEQLQTGATLKPRVLEVLTELGRACDLYLVAQVLDDASETAALSALDGAGLFAVGALNRNKVLFCGTAIGITSFVRQLEPCWHVDSSADTIDQLKKYVKYELHISQPGAQVTAPNVVSTTSLELYFGVPS
eukprot:jgi/Mesen1/1596/ME000134S00709